MRKILINNLIITTLKTSTLKTLFMLILLSCQLVNIKSQSKSESSPYLTVKTKFNKRASFYIEGDTVITFAEFKTQLSNESHYHLMNFEKEIKHYEIGRHITTLGFVLIPLGFMGDKLLWNNTDETRYYQSQISPYQQPITNSEITKGEKVYVGRIVGASIFFVGLIVRANTIAVLKKHVNEYNKFKIDVSPTYGLTKLNNQSLGLTLTLNF